MLQEVKIHEYLKLMGKDVNEHNIFKEKLKQICYKHLQEADIKTIDVYNLTGNSQDHIMEGNNRLVIFSNTNFKGAGNIEALSNYTTINGKGSYVLFLPPLEEDSLVINSKEGIPIAEYIKSKNILCILFDLFEKYSDDAVEIFDYIIKSLYNEIYLPILKRTSWKYTDNKEGLSEHFSNIIKDTKLRSVRDTQRSLRDAEEKIISYRTQLKLLFDSSIMMRNRIETETKQIEESTNEVIKELDLIINHPKITDLHVKDDKIIVHTVPLFATASNSNRYAIGEYKINISPNNCNIRFFSSIRRKSYWSYEDNHPHINAKGEACLGNADSTIAELCSQMQLYALVMVLIDFLESINLEDVAGRNCTNWDRVDENGNIIVKGGTENHKCNICGNRFTSTDLHVVWVDRDMEEDVMVCEDCRDEYYEFDDDLEAYIAID